MQAAPGNENGMDREEIPVAQYAPEVEGTKRFMISQKILSFLATFTVKDEAGQKLYSVKQQLACLMELQLKDYEGTQEYVRAKQQFICCAPSTYSLLRNGRFTTVILMS